MSYFAEPTHILEERLKVKCGNCRLRVSFECPRRTEDESMLLTNPMEPIILPTYACCFHKYDYHHDEMLQEFTMRKLESNL